MTKTSQMCNKKALFFVSLAWIAAVSEAFCPSTTFSITITEKCAIRSNTAPTAAFFLSHTKRKDCVSALTIMNNSEGNNDGADTKGRSEQLSQLGFDSTEQRNGKMLVSDMEEEKKVNVFLIPDVDAFTLTAIGFTLIAFNFFIFANLGDAGLSSPIARLINWLRY